jgi:hypothetical protein
MRPFILTILILLSTTLFGQNKLDKKVYINGSSSFDGAFLFFPLLNDIIKIDSFRHLSFDSSNQRRKLFYCVLNDEKSKIYNLDTDQLSDTTINFKIPDKDFFDNLYKLKICPLCHKNDNVIPFIYGKPGKELIKLANEGQVKLAGCSLSNTSPKFYCKRDKLEF